MNTSRFQTQPITIDEVEKARRDYASELFPLSSSTSPTHPRTLSSPGDPKPKSKYIHLLLCFYAEISTHMFAIYIHSRLYLSHRCFFCKREQEALQTIKRFQPTTVSVPECLSYSFVPSNTASSNNPTRSH